MASHVQGLPALRQVRHPDPGKLWTWSGASDTHLINLFAQDGSYGHGAKPGRATVTNVNHALRALAAEIQKEGYTGVALPRLAAGVGGLNWEEVEPLIEAHLGALSIPIIVSTSNFRVSIRAQRCWAQWVPARQSLTSVS